MTPKPGVFRLLLLGQGEDKLIKGLALLLLKDVQRIPAAFPQAGPVHRQLEDGLGLLVIEVQRHTADGAVFLLGGDGDPAQGLGLQLDRLTRLDLPGPLVDLQGQKIQGPVLVGQGITVKGGLGAPAEVLVLLPVGVKHLVGAQGLQKGLCRLFHIGLILAALEPFAVAADLYEVDPQKKQEPYQQ